jgi:hypothetical protein
VLGRRLVGAAGTQRWALLGVAVGLAGIGGVGADGRVADHALDPVDVTGGGDEVVVLGPDEGDAQRSVDVDQLAAGTGHVALDAVGARAPLAPLRGQR